MERGRSGSERCDFLWKRGWKQQLLGYPLPTLTFSFIPSSSSPRSLFPTSSFSPSSWLMGSHFLKLEQGRFEVIDESKWIDIAPTCQLHASSPSYFPFSLSFSDDGSPSYFESLYVPFRFMIINVTSRLEKEMDQELVVLEVRVFVLVPGVDGGKMGRRKEMKERAEAK